MTAKTETVETANVPAAPVATEPRKSKQVSATVPAEYFDGLVDHQWTARKKVTDIVREALDAYVADKGIKIDGSAPHHDAK